MYVMEGCRAYFVTLQVLQTFYYLAPVHELIAEASDTDLSQGL